MFAKALLSKIMFAKTLLPGTAAAANTSAPVLIRRTLVQPMIYRHLGG